MVEGGPWPTCKTEFQWNPAQHTLCITKEKGGKRATYWVDATSRPIGVLMASGPSKPPVTIMPVSPKLISNKPLKPNHRKIRSLVEPMCQWGQPSFFSCLDLDSCYEKGEASRESQASKIPAPMSPMMASPKNRKFKERWSPKSLASATMEALDQEPIGTNESPSMPFSINQSVNDASHGAFQ